MKVIMNRQAQGPAGARGKPRVGVAELVRIPEEIRVRC